MTPALDDREGAREIRNDVTMTAAFTALMDRGHVVGRMFCVLSTLSYIALISARPTRLG